MMECRICKTEVNKVFNQKILNKYRINYYHCKQCGFIQTEKPFWINEAYSEAIAESDTGVMERNIHCMKWTSPIIYFFFGRTLNYLDRGGGYGVFVRLMRDIGFNFYWSDKYSQNLLARGFDYQGQKIELCTAFEVFEHYEDPLREIEDMLKISDNILFTTNLLPKDIPSKNWWYYCFETGQHISLYSHKTLAYIAKKFNMKIYSHGNVHLFTKKSICRSLFSIVIRLSKLDIYRLIKKVMKGKTLEDMYFIIDKQRRLQND